MYSSTILCIRDSYTQRPGGRKYCAQLLDRKRSPYGVSQRLSSTTNALLDANTPLSRRGSMENTFHVEQLGVHLEALTNDLRPSLLRHREVQRTDLRE